MSRKSVLVLLFVIILVSLQYPRFQQNKVEASNGYPVHNLNTSLNYSGIQEALDAPETLSGHTIFVEKGIYHEALYINKSLALVGEDKFSTIIDGGGASGNVIYINVGRVNVTGFTLQNPDQYFSCMIVMASHCVINNNTMSGNGNRSGVWLSFAEFTTLNNNLITDCSYGIFIVDISTNNNIITNNVITNCTEGFVMQAGNHTLFQDNMVIGNEIGIDLQFDSAQNILRNNNFSGNQRAIYIFGGHDNSIYQNNFINNTDQVCIFYGIPPDRHPSNFWDTGSEGNFWSNYNWTDTNQDGIGDTPFAIDENNIDHNPLMGAFQSFNVSLTPQSFEEVDVISNITISDLGLYEWLTTPNQYLQAGQPFLRLFPVQDQNMTAGFCRMTLPNNMLNTSEYIVLINMTPVLVNKLAISNDTHTTLYFTFNSSALDGIIIVPEFPTFLVLPLFMIATLLVIILYKKNYSTRAQ